MSAAKAHDLEHLRALPTQEERRREFRRLALRYHPDKAAAPEKKDEATRLFQELLVARDGGEENLTEAWAQPEGVGACRLCVLPQRDVVHGVAFAGGGHTVAACGDSSRLMLWTGLEGLAAEAWRFPQRRAQLDDVEGTALAVAFLGEGRIAVALGNSVVIWEAAPVSTPDSRLDVEARALSLAVDSQNGRLAAGTEAGRIWIWKWQEAHRHCRLEAKLTQTPLVECVAFGCDGILLSGGGNSSLLIWRRHGIAWNACATLGSWQCPEVMYSVDVVGDFIAAGGAGPRVPIWTRLAEISRRTETESSACDDHDASDASSWAFPSDGEDDDSDKSFATEQGSDSVSTLQPPDMFASHSSDMTVTVNAVSLCPGGQRLATGGSDCRIMLWQLPGLTVLTTFVHSLPPGGCNLATATINHLRISPDGAVLAAGGYDMRISIWRLPGPAPIQDGGRAQPYSKEGSVWQA